MGNRRGKHRTTPRSKQRYRGAAESTSYTQRNRLLREMGFESYKHYLQSPLWAAIRSRVLTRDDRRCRACDARASQVHHNKYTEGTLTGRDLHHLFSLCADCHNAIEQNHGRVKRISVVRDRLAKMIGQQFATKRDHAQR